MNLPVAKPGLPPVTPNADVVWTCKKCQTTLRFPEGQKCPPCKCADIPPWLREPVTVYRKTEGCDGHEYMAEARPVGQRAIRAYGVNRDRVEAEVRAMLKVGT